MRWILCLQNFKEHALKSCTLNIRATWHWLMVSWFHDREIKWQHTDTRLHDVGGWCLNFFSGCVFIKESLPKFFVNWSVILFGHFSSFSFYLSGQGLKTIGHVRWPTALCKKFHRRCLTRPRLDSSLFLFFRCFF